MPCFLKARTSARPCLLLPLCSRPSGQSAEPRAAPSAPAAVALSRPGTQAVFPTAPPSVFIWQDWIMRRCFPRGTDVCSMSWMVLLFRLSAGCLILEQLVCFFIYSCAVSSPLYAGLSLAAAIGSCSAALHRPLIARLSLVAERRL